MVDGDFKLNESRAIAAYLANAYAKDDSIYPKEPKVRARVDQLMYFDMGQLYMSFGECFVSILFFIKCKRFCKKKYFHFVSTLMIHNKMLHLIQ